MQEVHIDKDTFSECKFLSSNFIILPNNAENKYGTATLVRNDLTVENVMCDTSGRILVLKFPVLPLQIYTCLLALTVYPKIVVKSIVQK